MNLNKCLDILVSQGLATYPPENVRLRDYDTLIATAQEFGNGWIPPTLEMFESVSEQAELIQAKAVKIQTFKAFAKAEIEVTDWKIIRHRDQIDNNVTTSLTNADYLLLLIARQNIRDKSNSLENQVNNATTLAQLEAILWT